LEKTEADRKKTEACLRESEKKYRSLLETTSEGFWLINSDLKTVEVNQSLCEMLGYRQEEMIGKTPFDFVDDDNRKIFIEQTSKISDTTHRTYKITLKKKNGQNLHTIFNAITLRDESDKVKASFAFITNITHEVELEKQLLHARKMESIGTLAGGIAHEFNNILSIIIPNAELAIDNVPDRSLAKECLNEIRSASLRAMEVVQQILGFARRSIAKREPVRISPIIKDSLKLIRASISATISISQEISCEFDTVLADPTQISQVVMNLCSNAAHAMREHGGALKVTLKNIELEKQDAVSELEPGCYVALTVSDTGHGIPPEIIGRIFDPYFTAKELGEGTGMGLSLVHGIVKSCHGIITVNSEPEKGTVFEMLLPVIEGETEPKVEKPDISPTGTERILFVDDEPSLVKVARSILKRLGYEVETKINSVEALELFCSGPDRFDLVITDMNMPQMSGQRLVREILNIRPDMPIILCTGFSEKISEKNVEEFDIKAFVIKPFSTHNLARAVRKVLDKK